MTAPTWHVVTSQGRVVLGVFGSALLADAQACAARAERDTGLPAFVTQVQGARPSVGDVLPRPPLKYPTGCPACRHVPGVLVGVNGGEVQRCDDCAPKWSDEDAVAALREAYPWIVVAFEPDRDEETGAVADPSIGVYVFDYAKTEIPPDAPAWLVRDLWPAKPRGRDAAVEALQTLCATIENTGGLLHPTEDEDGNVPITDPDWADLGDAYLAACKALGKEPVYSATKLCVKCGAEIPRPVLAQGTSERCAACAEPDDEDTTGACPKCGSLSPWRCEHAAENTGVKTSFACSRCKGRNVDMARWVDANTNQPTEDEPVFEGRDGCWCRDCKEHVDLIEVPS